MSNHIITTPAGPFRVGLLGCGKQGSEIRLPAVRALVDDGVVLAAVADSDPERARLAAEKFEVPEYGSLRKMIAKAKLDGVIVALPPAAQRDAVEYALGRGLHVICEAPVGVDAREAEKMIAAAHRAQRILAAGYQLPVQAHWPLEYVRSPGIGMQSRIEASWMLATRAPDGSIRDRAGFWDQPGGRGLGVDLGSHLLSVGLRLPGSSPVAVTVTRSTEDALDMFVEFGNEARGRFVVGWEAERTADEAGISAFGSRGSIAVPLMLTDTNAEPFRPTVIGQNGKPRRGDQPIPPGEAIVVQLRNWVDACRGRAGLLSSPQHALGVHRVLAPAFDPANGNGRRVLLATR